MSAAPLVLAADAARTAGTVTTRLLSLVLSIYLLVSHGRPGQVSAG